MEGDDEDAKKPQEALAAAISSSAYKHNMSKTWYIVYTE